MTVTRERTEVRVGVADAHDPLIQAWLAKLRARNTHFSYEADPQKWIGLYAGRRLLAAIAHKPTGPTDILIEAIACEPTKAGRVAAQALWLALAQSWNGKRVTFFVSRANRKMLRALPTGSVEVARMYQVRI